MFTVVSKPLIIVKSYNYCVKRETRQPVPAEHLLHVPIIINKQTNKKGEKKNCYYQRRREKKPLHIKLLNGHDPQF